MLGTYIASYYTSTEGQTSPNIKWDKLQFPFLLRSSINTTLPISPWNPVFQMLVIINFCARVHRPRCPHYLLPNQQYHTWHISFEVYATFLFLSVKSQCLSTRQPPLPSTGSNIVYKVFRGSSDAWTEKEFWITSIDWQSISMWFKVIHNSYLAFDSVRADI